MDISLMLKLFAATWISCFLHSVKSASLRWPSAPAKLPLFRRPLPQYDDVSGDAVDGGLTSEFPGQFYSKEEIGVINSRALLQGRRRRRAVDRDLCCVTDIWFGSAPGHMVDASQGKNWTIVQGAQVQQAFSRGECHINNPQSLCPPGGKCRQKYRLHTIWVHNGTEAVLQYFNVPSHCSYEPA